MNADANTYLKGLLWTLCQHCSWETPVSGYFDGSVDSIPRLAFLNHTEWQTLDEREEMEKNKRRLLSLYSLRGCWENTQYKGTKENNELNAQT